MAVDTFRYLLSAVAQSAAAFVGVIAVFAVFRLQAHHKELEDIYKELEQFLVKYHGNRNEMKIYVNKSEMEKTLEECVKQDKYKEAAKNFQNRINLAKKNINDVASNISAPMKKWAIIFFASIVSLYFCEYIFLINIMIWFGFYYIAYALLETKNFIQDALKTEIIE